MFEYCKLADVDILNMFDALLRNTKVHPTLKSIAAFLLAHYLIDHLGDALSGINVLEQAKHLDPRQMAVRRNLIRLYRLSGQLDRAAAELQEARGLDRLREIGPELDQEETKLREARSTFGATGK
jgi:protein involved in temperature-dependent protein secretion